MDAALLKATRICARRNDHRRASIGCKEGFVVYPARVSDRPRRLLKAIEQARDYGLLGKESRSGMDFDIEIVQGPELCMRRITASWLPGRERGRTEAKYITPVEYGYKNRPTNLTNVETWANVP